MYYYSKWPPCDEGISPVAAISHGEKCLCMERAAVGVWMQDILETVYKIKETPT